MKIRVVKKRRQRWIRANKLYYYKRFNSYPNPDKYTYLDKVSEKIGHARRLFFSVDDKLIRIATRRSFGKRDIE